MRRGYRVASRGKASAAAKGTHARRVQDREIRGTRWRSAAGDARTVPPRALEGSCGRVDPDEGAHRDRETGRKGNAQPQEPAEPLAQASASVPPLRQDEERRERSAGHDEVEQVHRLAPGAEGHPEKEHEHAADHRFENRERGAPGSAGGEWAGRRERLFAPGQEEQHRRHVVETDDLDEDRQSGREPREEDPRDRRPLSRCRSSAQAPSAARNRLYQEGMLTK